MGDKAVSVASSVYNLAGPQSRRPDFLKSLLIGGIMRDVPSMAEVISTGYRNGPGLRLRRYANWAKKNPEFQAALGITSGELEAILDVDLSVVLAALTLNPGETAQIDYAELGGANIVHWARRWVSENHPTLLNTNFESDYDSDTGEIQVYLERAAETDPLVPMGAPFTPLGYDESARYIYAGYTPSLAGVALDQRIFIYKQSDGSATLDALFTPGDPEDAGGFYPPIPFRHLNKPITDKPQEYKLELPEIVTDALLPGDIVAFARSVADGEAEDPRPSAYQYGKVTVPRFAGLTTVVNVNDGWLSDLFEKDLIPFVRREPRHGDGAPVEWLPCLSRPVGTPSPTIDTHALCKKAFKKAFDSDFDKVLESIQKNVNINDIDYCQAVFGVSLNAEDNASRKYIYKFFQTLMNVGAVVDESSWWLQWHEANESFKAGANPPIPYPVIPWKKITVKSQHTGVTVYRISMHWAFITEETGAGVLRKPDGKDARPGDVWIKIRPDPFTGIHTYGHMIGSPYLNQRIRLYYQETKDTWRRMTVTGMHHKNEVYKNKFVTTTAKQALNPAMMSKESPFVVPLHEGVFDQMSLRDRTQMGSACCLLVFNCYEAKQLEWYQSDWFQIVVMVGIVIIAIATAVISGGSSLGLLGSASAVGAALGLSGTAAIIVGAAVNALAAIVVGTLIGKVSAEAFGEKWGAIIGAIATFALTFGAGAFSNGANLIDSITSPQGLIGLSTATANGTSVFLKESAEEVAKETMKMMERANAELAKLMKKTEEEFGSSKKIDPSLVDQYIDELTEKPEAFLARTLLTGSDIVELNLASLHNFADFTLQAKLP